MGNDIQLWQNHADKRFAIMLKKFWAGLSMKEKREFRESLFEVIGRSPYGAHDRIDGRTAADYDEHAVFRFFGIILTDDPNWNREYEHSCFKSFLGQLRKDLKAIPSNTVK